MENMEKEEPYNFSDVVSFRREIYEKLNQLKNNFFNFKLRINTLNLIKRKKKCEKIELYFSERNLKECAIEISVLEETNDFITGYYDFHRDDVYNFRDYFYDNFYNLFNVLKFYEKQKENYENYYMNVYNDNILTKLKKQRKLNKISEELNNCENKIDITFKKIQNVKRLKNKLNF